MELNQMSKTDFNTENASMFRTLQGKISFLPHVFKNRLCPGIGVFPRCSE